MICPEFLNSTVDSMFRSTSQFSVQIVNYPSTRIIHSVNENKTDL